MANTTCTAADGGGGGRGDGEIMLFGVRVSYDPMRKSVSLNNLSQYEQPQDLNNNNNNTNKDNGCNRNTSIKDDVSASAVTPGYASADDAVPHSSSTRGERKRGVPWTEDEHKLFLIGLQKVGKGDWRGISRNYVKTRTPTQVASHAQKYFLRRSNLNRRRRRSSLFDITTDSVSAFPMEEEPVHRQESNNSSTNSSPRTHPLPPQIPETTNITPFSVMPMLPPAFSITNSSPPAVVPFPIETPMEKLSLMPVYPAISTAGNLIRPVPVMPASYSPDLNLNLKSSVDSPSSLSLKLSLPCDQRESPSRHSAFQVMSSFNNGDGIITVA